MDRLNKHSQKSSNGQDQDFGSAHADAEQRLTAGTKEPSHREQLGSLTQRLRKKLGSGGAGTEAVSDSASSSHNEGVRSRCVASRFDTTTPQRLQKAIATMLNEEIVDKDDSFASVEHLSAEAVAGYVDGELSLKAQKRARAHLLHCSMCRRDVREQREASLSLRGNSDSDIHVPASLVEKLASLSSDTCMEGPKAGDILESDTLLGRLNSMYWAARRTYKDRTD